MVFNSAISLLDSRRSVTVFSGFSSTSGCGSGVFTSPVIILVTWHGDRCDICELSRLGLVRSGSNVGQQQMVTRQVSNAVQDAWSDPVLSGLYGGAGSWSSNESIPTWVQKRYQQVGITVQGSVRNVRGRRKDGQSDSMVRCRKDGEVR